MGEFFDHISSIVAEVYIDSEAVASVILKSQLDKIINHVTKFKESRFENRMLLFLSDDYSYISKEEKQSFFESISAKDKDMISSLIEKIYNADYDIHVHIYKFLYQNLLKNKTLNYYEHSLFTNMQQFTSLDFEIYWYQINSNITGRLLFDANNQIEWEINKKVETDILSIKKFISFGLLQQGEIKTDSGAQQYGMIADIRIDIEPVKFKISKYMFSIYEIIDKYIDDTTKNDLKMYRKSDTVPLDEYE